MTEFFDKVLWQTTTSFEIDRIIVHPREDSFAVFHCSTFNRDGHTKVSIFRVPSYIPAATFSVPFGLQNVIWNSIGKGTGYNLVGITHDWRVVVLGDTQLPSRGDNLPTKGLDIADRSEKRTLFEDIFGSSAFANGNSEPLQSTSTMSSHVRKQEGSRHELFDKPAYLMPSLDNLFDPLVTSLLSNRIPEVDPKISEADEEDEDVTMIDDTVQQPLVTTTRPTRIPNQGEMELFTQLFRTTSITSTSVLFYPNIFMIVLKNVSITLESPPVSLKVNGKTNGVHSLKSNGVSSHSIGTKPTHRPPSNDVGPHEGSTPEPSSSIASPPIFKGKKREKVLVEAVVSSS